MLMLHQLLVCAHNLGSIDCTAAGSSITGCCRASSIGAGPTEGGSANKSSAATGSSVVEAAGGGSSCVSMGTIWAAVG